MEHHPTSGGHFSRQLVLISHSFSIVNSSALLRCYKANTNVTKMLDSNDSASPMRLFIGDLIKENLGVLSCTDPSDVALVLVTDNAHAGRTSASDLLDQSLCDGHNEEISRRERRLRKRCEMRWLPSEDYPKSRQTQGAAAPPSPPKRHPAKSEELVHSRWSASPTKENANQDLPAKYSAPIRPRRHLENSPKTKPALHRSSNSIFMMLSEQMDDPKKEQLLLESPSLTPSAPIAA
jgi:hypothetical protein